MRRQIIGLMAMVLMTGCVGRDDMAGVRGVAPAASQPLSGCVVLASAGQAQLPVILHPDASTTLQDLAAELTNFLGRITGGTFPIVRSNDNTTAGIVVGTIDQWPGTPIPPADLAITNQFDGRRAFAIRCLRNPPRLMLIGATELAAQHAVFRFLEEVGCRWFFPGKNWEIIPSLPTLAVNTNITERPAFLNNLAGCGPFRDPCNRADGQRSKRECDAWLRRNRLGQSVKGSCGHAWQAIISTRQSEFDAHPEYYAWVVTNRAMYEQMGYPHGGERKGPQIEVGNSNVLELAVRYTTNVFARSPGLDMVSLGQSDGAGFSESPEALALGLTNNVSQQVFALANHVARALRQMPAYSNKWVAALAYGPSSIPPSFPLEPNVVVYRTRGYTYGRYNGYELLEMWPKVCKNMAIYEYYDCWPWCRAVLPECKLLNPADLQAWLIYYAEKGYRQILPEHVNESGMSGLGFYLYTQWTWNPQADREALLSDFYQKAFGPAATVMRRYYERIDCQYYSDMAKRNDFTLFGKDTLAQCYRDLDLASKLAGEDPAVLARLDDLKIYLHYNALWWKLRRATDMEAGVADTNSQKSLALDILTHSYRTRYAYMTPWEILRSCWGDGMAGHYGETNGPTSWLCTNATAPWRNTNEMTRAEIEADFHAEMDYFQPQPVTPVEYSDDLVPVTFPGTPPQGITSMTWGTDKLLDHFFACYSLAGEPIELDIAVNSECLPHYRLTDTHGIVVTNGTMKQTGWEHLTLDVPGRGLYYFDCDSTGFGASWTIKAATNQPLGYIPTKAFVAPGAGTFENMYFYVPKGNTNVQFFLRSGLPDNWGVDRSGWIGVYAVTGTTYNAMLVATLTNNMENITIPVPKGMDGTVWKFAKRAGYRYNIAFNQLYFYNVPNVLAKWPNALLLPREVAKAGDLMRR